MKTIKQKCIIPSAAYSVPKKCIKQYAVLPEKIPSMGDLIYGEVEHIGYHSSLESRSARIHTIHENTRAVFVCGNRYAPDHYEGVVPDTPVNTFDLLARSGLVGAMTCQNERISAPTQIKILGYIYDVEGTVINTRDHILIKPRQHAATGLRAKLILCIGTSMNSGKSRAAATCCYALSSMGKAVRAAKVTGTASLKDILLMEDCGAQHIADFTYFGFPSTYLLEREELLSIFHAIDMKYGNNRNNYLVIEFADGIFQRETAILLREPSIRSRIHKCIFCAADSAGTIGGLTVLKNNFDLTPCAISGVCSSSPLALREIAEFTDLPILKSIERDYKSIYKIIA